MTRNEVRQRRLLVAGLLVAALFAVGVLLNFTGRPRSSSARQTNGAQPAASPTLTEGAAGPISVQAGAPGGFRRDEDGAVAAAVAYATASQRWLYFTDDEITAAVAGIATPVAAARLATDVVAEVGLAREQLGTSPGRVWWLVRPMGWRVEHHGTDEARVSVWVVTVLSAAEVAAPQAEWMTITIDLAWVDADWRVDGVRDAPGPTPITGPGDQPWDAEPFDAALDGFARMDGEPVA